MDYVQFTVNGRKCKVNNESRPTQSLNSYIRDVLGLPGTKSMCREGGCGSCVVSVSALRPSGEVETFAVNSCLVLVYSCHGWSITTVEGLGSRRDGYNDIQTRMSKFHATQCGYCTPGWVMTMDSLRDKHLTMEELEKSFAGNTCRCTGFRPIMDTMKSFAVDADPSLLAKVKDMDSQCCQSNRCCETKCSESSEEAEWEVCDALKDALPLLPVQLDFGSTIFHKVYEEDHIFEILKEEDYKDCMFIVGNTGKGVLESFNYPRVLIDISDVKSMNGYFKDQNLVIGANSRLEDAITWFREISSTDPAFAYLGQFASHIELVANVPVRQIGSFAGNLMMKKRVKTFQSDIFLLLSCVRATLTIRHKKDGTKSISMVDFLSYNMEGSLIVNIELPPLGDDYQFMSYKVMPRSQNALAVVNAAFLLQINKSSNAVQDASIAYGNIRTDFYYAKKTEKYLKGKNVFTNKVLQRAIQTLISELVPEIILHEPSPQARKKLAVGLFYKFILNISDSRILSPTYRSGGELIKRPLSSGTQDYQLNEDVFPLNQPVQKLEAPLQSAGEAIFTNDVPKIPHEVFGAFVLSTIHSGEIDTIDGSNVMKVKGVLAVYTAKDIPGKNSFTLPGLPLITAEEELLASNKILFYGQPVAIVVANNRFLAESMAKQVKVTYKNVSTAAPVLTIDQAKKDSSRYKPSDVAIKPVSRGVDVTKVIKGVFELGGQYHYYIEPLSTVIIPVDNRLEVYDTTQWVDLTQTAIAQTCGIRESDIVVKVPRVGGGFGGKITRNGQVAAACAVVAKNMDKPCRFILPMQTNMAISGSRLPSQFDYEVGVNDNGKIQYLDVTIVEDQGCSTNEDILSYAMESFTNCYDKNTWNVKTANCLTDKPSNTFMRGPGAVEGIAAIEHVMEHIAFETNRNPVDVRLENMRSSDNDIPTLIEDLKVKADYVNREKAIREFNAANRWMKKAININVMSFPVVYYGNYGAYVSIYQGDGSVSISCGGIEMGQGINTKAAQVCAYTLGIPLDLVNILPSYSFVNPNNVFSGSSITSESVSYSIIKSCNILKERLEPIKQEMGGNPSWLELIKKAGIKQVNLSAGYMMKDTEPDLKPYSAFGVHIIETQLDVLTGRFEILRSDILEDVGLSANPDIDVGQIEGGFMQGIGYFVCEKLVYDLSSGKLLTNRSLNYHVPLARDIPADFRINLRYNSKNTTGVLGSKAVGEMGVCLGCGVMFALRSCIYASRYDSGYEHTWINIDIPYDTESILKALDVKEEEFILNQRG
ncbi:probable aldehyde oxidase gad-3 [Plutella xylostella]|uniref:probable aldehyde oxidase gad-3 n=1 Tax=Plutella xylostella TaxID=51655 RepID=UPI002032F378|nr:probable aldehyde oxidase gad-3 [Plutella xylostella]XP_048479119.1 probable aldehyde oxidase gad-3 [Plutella xylostella]